MRMIDDDEMSENLLDRLGEEFVDEEEQTVEEWTD